MKPASLPALSMVLFALFIASSTALPSVHATPPSAPVPQSSTNDAQSALRLPFVAVQEELAPWPADLPVDPSLRTPDQITNAFHRHTDIERILGSELAARSFTEMDRQAAAVRAELLGRMGATLAGSSPLARAQTSTSVTLPPVDIGHGFVLSPSGHGSSPNDITVRLQVAAEQGAYAGITFVNEQQRTEVIDQCPDAEGVIHGRYIYAVRIDITVPREQAVAHNISLVSRHVEIDARVEGTGYVNEDARLTEFDIEVNFLASVTGDDFNPATGTVVHVPANIERGRAAAQRLHFPLATEAEILAAWSRVGIGYWGPRGRITSGPQLENLSRMAQLALFSFGTESGQFGYAQRFWYDQMGCLTIVFDPSSLELSDGEQQSVTVRVQQRNDGSAVAARLLASTTEPSSCAGTVAPASATTTTGGSAQFRFTAPNPWPDQVAACFAVSAISKRGRAAWQPIAATRETAIRVWLAEPTWSHTLESAARTIRFRFPDDNARSVVFRNPFAAPGPDGQPTAHVRARYRLVDQPADAWIEEDWTGRNQATFCRDSRAQRLDDLEIIVTDVRSTPAAAPQLEATNMGCWRWQGSTTTTYRDESSGTIPRGLVQTVTADVTFGRGLPQRNQQEGFQPIAGSMVWRLDGVADNGSYSGCRYTAGPLTMQLSSTAGSLITWNYVTSPSNSSFRGYNGSGSQGFWTTATVSCSDGQYTEHIYARGWWLATNGGTVDRVSTDGTRLHGEHHATNGTLDSSWTLSAQREP